MDSKNGIDNGHNYDFILKWMAEVLRGGSLDFMGVNVGQITDVFGFEPVDICVRVGRVDIMVRNEAANVFHIKEQRNLWKSDIYHLN